MGNAESQPQGEQSGFSDLFGCGWCTSRKPVHAKDLTEQQQQQQQQQQPRAPSRSNSIVSDAAPSSRSSSLSGVAGTPSSSASTSSIHLSSGSMHSLRLSPPVTLSRSHTPFIEPPFVRVGRPLRDASAASLAAQQRGVDGLLRDTAQVITNVFVAPSGHAENRALLAHLRITLVVNCAAQIVPCRAVSDGIGYVALRLDDVPGEQVSDLFMSVAEAVEEEVRAGGRVLVHCHQGVSRSNAIVVAFIMLSRRITYQAAHGQVNSRRHLQSINSGFIGQLHELQHMVMPSPTPHQLSRLPRVYRVAPHSALDDQPVAKLLLHPTTRRPMRPSAAQTFLDPRTVFIVHSSDYVAVWIGARCVDREARLAAALAHVRRLRRYISSHLDAGHTFLLNASDAPADLSEFDALGPSDPWRVFSAMLSGHSVLRSSKGGVSDAKHELCELYDAEHAVVSKRAWPGVLLATGAVEAPTPVVLPSMPQDDDISTQKIGHMRWSTSSNAWIYMGLYDSDAPLEPECAYLVFSDDACYLWVGSRSPLPRLRDQQAAQGVLATMMDAMQPTDRARLRTAKPVIILQGSETAAWNKFIEYA